MHFIQERFPSPVHPFGRHCGGLLGLLAVFLAASSLSAQNKAKPAAKEAAITEKEATEFAAALAEAVQAGDADAFVELVDWGGMVDKGTVFPNLPELQAARKEFKTGVMSAMSKGGGVLGAVHTLVQQGGGYKAIHVDVRGKVPQIVFRLKLPNDGGLNYHRFSLARKPGGTIVASDMYIFTTAEEMSATFRRGWLAVANQAIKAEGGNAKVPTDPFLTHLGEYQKIASLFSEKKHAEALTRYRKLPEAVRKDKSLMVIALTSAQSVSDKDYLQAIDDFRKAYPKDPALDLILIDSYALRKQYDETLQCIDRLNAAVGGRDAVLLAKRAAMLLEQAKVADARKAVDAAMALEPEERDGYAVGLDVALAEKNFDDTAKFMTVLEKKFGLQWQNLEQVAEFAEFLKSPQYQEWLKTQEK